MLLFTAACSEVPSVTRGPGTPSTIDPARRAEAVQDAKALRARGRRVWCVPFARTASGIDIRGNARTWWAQAAERFDRGHTPKVGAVMTFRATHTLPLGHVAVVSKVISPREILVDQANWHRNRVSLGMAVIDVSDKNDWSRVRVESTPDQFGSVYPVMGFIWSPGVPVKAPTIMASASDAKPADKTADRAGAEIARAAEVTRNAHAGGEYQVASR
ncbi:CHAP domain-containing protein [Acidimangrovimonas sediminis]|uniref:CHAP domain-containing protein n=1 Tax=Acidimangrovimonas sediminis TaxID=2056283 RepID=UPI002FCDEBBC